jgi:hypothetical protein
MNERPPLLKPMMKETLLTRREFSKKISLVAGARTGN